MRNAVFNNRNGSGRAQRNCRLLDALWLRWPGVDMPIGKQRESKDFNDSEEKVGM